MLLFVAMWGCNDFTLNPVDPSGPPPVIVPVVERFVQQPLSQVDVLFVVDDTASMQQELQALGDQLPTLLDTLDASGMDWQLGVTSADVDGPWPGYLSGSPYVITPAHPNPQGTFRDRLPEAGGTGEAGLDAAVLALELASPDGPNAGFRRSGAVLQVLFVSDADDRSQRGVAEVLAALDSIGGERGARVSALVGDVPGGCASPNGTAQAGFRYQDLVEATDGRWSSICTIDFEDLLVDLADDSIELPTFFPLAGAPLANSVVVTVDGSFEAWSASDEPPGVVFEQAPASGAVIEVRYTRREMVEADE